MNVLLIPPLLGLVGMVAALIVYRLVMKYPDGQDKVKKIGDQIHNGALAFMKTESSVDISNVTPKGRLGRISLSSLSFILLIISTVLELATLTIPRPTDGRLLNLAVSL